MAIGRRSRRYRGGEGKDTRPSTASDTAAAVTKAVGGGRRSRRFRGGRFRSRRLRGGTSRPRRMRGGRTRRTRGGRRRATRGGGTFLNGLLPFGFWFAKDAYQGRRAKGKR